MKNPAPPKIDSLITTVRGQKVILDAELASAGSERAVKPLVDTTNFWRDRHGKHLVLLGYPYQITKLNAARADLRPLIQTLRLAVENHRA